ncbi:MAG: glucosyltransferase domain-containing protein [Lachnospiraceae bacterium]|nr:glucosyltransferase domain-containing protein [Lachnospiraceae bacterium]
MKKKYEEIIAYIKKDKAVILRVLFTALATAALAYSVLANIGFGAPDSLNEGLLYNRAKDAFSEEGRWAVRFLLVITHYLAPPPLIICLYCIIAGATGYVLIKLWKIEKAFSQIIVTAVMCVAPGAVCQLAYLYMGLVFAFSGLAAAIFVFTGYRKKIGSVIVGMIAVDVMLGTYQTYVGLAALAAILTLSLMLAEGKKIKEVAEGLLFYAVTGIGGSIFYLIHIKIDMTIFGLSSGSRVDEVSLSETVKCMPMVTSNAYKDLGWYFFSPIVGRHLFYGVFFALLLFAVIRISAGLIKEKKIWNPILLAVFILIAPVAANICAYLTPFQPVDYLMNYQLILVIPFALALFELQGRTGKSDRTLKPASVCCSLICAVIAWTYIISANATYMCFQYSYNRAFEQTRLILNDLYDNEEFRMEADKPGLHDDEGDGVKLMIAGFVDDRTAEYQHNVYKLSYKFNFHDNAAFYEDMNGIRNGWYYFLLEYFGLETARFSESDFAEMAETPEFKAMSVWPEEGSIGRIGDYFVVKLTNDPPMPERESD